MTKRIKEVTNANVDHNGIPERNYKFKFKPGNLLIPAIFGGILLFLFWISKCQ